jgi:hypothetical protein
MMNKIKYGYFLVALTFSVPTLAASSVDAEGLHAENCVRCHDQSVYTRPDRSIQSYSSLSQRVKRCEIPAKVTWSEEQLKGVVDFLNENYYMF